MCGIAGFIDQGHRFSDPTRVLKDFVKALSHRGPDDSGTFHDPSFGIGLSHTRLSILDTSSAGHQPMVSRDQRWVLVYNGEIYNSNELKASLGDPRTLNGHSDTEILCETIARFGVVHAARSAVGMYAFAVWDSHDRKLHLVRDRIGIKPLFFAFDGHTVAFASESRVLSQLDGLCGEIDSESLQVFLRFGYIPGSRSIHENVRKVEPGTCVTIDPCDGISLSTTRWWSAYDHAQANIVEGDDAYLLSEVASCIDASVSSQLASDRPLGTFLSGGIDSSLIAATMVRLSSGTVRTFSLGFSDYRYDESGHARAVSRHLGTCHTEHRITDQDVLEVVPGLGGMFDEPFADSSQIPTFLLCRMTRRDVVVSLSGDGGDELFGGYPRYEWAVRLWNLIGRIPPGVRRSSAFSLGLLPGWFPAKVVSMANMILPSRLRVRSASAKGALISNVLKSTDVSDLYFRILTHWDPLRHALCGVDSDLSEFSLPDLSSHDEQHRMMLWDQSNYLPDDLLVKLDRASMSVGLEARVPLLDHRLVELAWRLPSRMKMRGNETKWALRRLLERDVPSELFDRTKMGFGVPLGDWLRGPLRDWAEALLDPTRLQQGGHLNASVIRRVWDAHLSGKVDHSQSVWDVLMFQSWIESR